MSKDEFTYRQFFVWLGVILTIFFVALAFILLIWTIKYGGWTTRVRV